MDYWRWSEDMDVVSNDHYLIAADERNFQDLAHDGGPHPRLGAGQTVAPDGTLHLGSQLAAPQRGQSARAKCCATPCSTWPAAPTACCSSSGAPPAPGAEKYHSGWCRTPARDTKVWREVVELGRALGSISEVAGSTVATADALAILHDTDARWGTELDSHPSEDARNLAETRRWHDALYRAGVTTDIRQSTDDLSGYKLVMAPMLYLVTDEGATKLDEYVAPAATSWSPISPESSTRTTTSGWTRSTAAVIQGPSPNCWA